MPQDMKNLVKEYLDEERYQQSTPYVSSSHNFKINMKDMFHQISMCVSGNKQFSILYKMLLDVNQYNMVIINSAYIKRVGSIHNKTYYDFINRIEATTLLKRIDGFKGQRGTIKYMINPYIIYNFRKCKSNKQFMENCDLWNSITKEPK